MRRLTAVLLALVLLPACGRDDCGANCTKRPDQKANDHLLPQSSYDDYFVDDSDGHKDGVFTIYHDVRIQGQLCDVLKVYEDSGIAVSTVCLPN